MASNIVTAEFDTIHHLFQFDEKFWTCVLQYIRLI